MTPERWRQIKEIVSAAADLPLIEQASFLSRACDGDPALREEAESLLSQLEEPGFLDSGGPVLEAEGFPVPESLTGRRLGPYQLLEEIGRGGMGAVYRAVRADDQYQMQVAIKLMRGGLDSGFFLSRFRNERQILAGLEHPNIARLLDGGATGNGHPYLVMEYVQGEPLDAYCDSRQLPIRERLELFRAVCSAVQYAHQRLVVHRDIKPGNILVTPQGVPKLVDFGIAKIIDPALAPGGAPPTRTALRLMTPEYASPEQIRGEQITTATDIYSLGVVLYELITGRRPYCLTCYQPLEVARAVCEQDPQRPSTAINRSQEETPPGGQAVPRTPAQVSQARGSDPQKLARLLRSDLDAIVLKALRKEPRGRYTTVEQLSRDLRRYAEGLPVLAHKGTRSYLARKFLRRHRAAVAVVCVALVLCVAGVAAIIREARIARMERARAEQRFNDVRKLANSLLSDLHDAIQDLPGSTPARQMLAQKALVNLDSLAREASDDPQLQIELASAYLRMGDVQGNPFYPNLGDAAGAVQSYGKALATLEALAASNPRNQECLRGLASAYRKLGEALEPAGDSLRALAYYRKSQVIAEKLAQSSSDPADHDNLAGGYYTIALALEQSGDLAGALRNLEKSAAIRNSITGDTPDHALVVQRELAGVYGSIAEVHMLRAQYDQALRMEDKTLALMQQVVKAKPAEPRNQTFLAETYYYRGRILQKTGEAGEAMESYRQAYSILQRLVQLDPDDAFARRLLGFTLVRMGTAVADRGNAADALRLLSQALNLFQALPSGGKRNDFVLTGLAECYFGYGRAYAALASRGQATLDRRLKSWQEARSWYQRSLEIWHEMGARNALDGDDREGLKETAREIALCDASLKHLRNALILTTP